MGEALSSVLPKAVPRSGALDIITFKVVVGFDRITLDMFFLVLDLGLKVRFSLLGVFVALAFVMIGRTI